MGYRDRLKFNIPNLTYAEPSYGTPVGYNNQSPAQRLSKPLQNLLGVAGKVAQQDIAKTQQEEVQAFKLEGIELDKQAKLKQIKFDKEFKESQLKWKFEYDQDKISYEEMKEQQIREGGLIRRRYNQKSFAELEASGLINASENPWLAFGAMEYEGQIGKNRFEQEVRDWFAEQELNPDVLYNPINGVELFDEMMDLNRAKNYIQLPQNYVAQEAFLKGSESFYASMKAQYMKGFNAHALGVRRNNYNFRGGSEVSEFQNAQEAFKNMDTGGLDEAIAKVDPPAKALTTDREKREFLNLDARKDLAEDWQVLSDDLHRLKDIGEDPTNFLINLLNNTQLSPMDKEYVINSLRSGTGKLSNTEKGKAYLSLLHDAALKQSDDEWTQKNISAIYNLKAEIKLISDSVNSHGTNVDSLRTEYFVKINELYPTGKFPEENAEAKANVQLELAAGVTRNRGSLTQTQKTDIALTNWIQETTQDIVAGGAMDTEDIVGISQQLQNIGSTSTKIMPKLTSAIREEIGNFVTEYNLAEKNKVELPLVSDGLRNLFAVAAQYKEATGATGLVQSWTPAGLSVASDAYIQILGEEHRAGRLGLHMKPNTPAYNMFVNAYNISGGSTDSTLRRSLVTAYDAYKQDLKSERAGGTLLALDKVIYPDDDDGVKNIHAADLMEELTGERGTPEQYNQIFQAWAPTYAANLVNSDPVTAAETTFNDLEGRFSIVEINGNSEFHILEDSESKNGLEAQLLKNYNGDSDKVEDNLHNFADYIRDLQNNDIQEIGDKFTANQMEIYKTQAPIEAQANYEAFIAEKEKEDRSFIDLLNLEDAYEHFCSMEIGFKLFKKEVFNKTRDEVIPVFETDLYGPTGRKSGDRITGANLDYFVKKLLYNSGNNNPTQNEVNQVKNNIAFHIRDFKPFSPDGQAEFLRDAEYSYIESSKKGYAKWIKDNPIAWNKLLIDDEDRLNDNFNMDHEITINRLVTPEGIRYTLQDEDGIYLSFRDLRLGPVTLTAEDFMVDK